VSDSVTVTREDEVHLAVESAERVVRARPKLTHRRASDSPFIAVAMWEYLRVVQTLARRVVTFGAVCLATHEGEHDSMQDTALFETLSRWGMNPAAWLTQLHRLDHQCTRVLGTASNVFERARGVAQQRFHGIRLCRELFAASRSDAFT